MKKAVFVCMYLCIYVRINMHNFNTFYTTTNILWLHFQNNLDELSPEMIKHFNHAISRVLFQVIPRGHRSY